MTAATPPTTAPAEEADPHQPLPHYGPHDAIPDDAPIGSTRTTLGPEARTYRLVSRTVIMGEASTVWAPVEPKGPAKTPPKLRGEAARLAKENARLRRVLERGLAAGHVDREVVARALQPYVPTPAERRLQKVLRDLQGLRLAIHAQLTGLETQVRKRGGACSAEGKTIYRLKRLATVVHMAMCGVRMRLGGPDRQHVRRIRTATGAVVELTLADQEGITEWVLAIASIHSEGVQGVTPFAAVLKLRDHIGLQQVVEASAQTIAAGVATHLRKTLMAGGGAFHKLDPHSVPEPQGSEQRSPFFQVSPRRWEFQHDTIERLPAAGDGQIVARPDNPPSGSKWPANPDSGQTILVGTPPLPPPTRSDFAQRENGKAFPGEY